MILVGLKGHFSLLIMCFLSTINGNGITNSIKTQDEFYMSLKTWPELINLLGRNQTTYEVLRTVPKTR